MKKYIVFGLFIALILSIFYIRFPKENTEKLCSDDLDNNYNGKIDCVDKSCSSCFVCNP